MHSALFVAIEPADHTDAWLTFVNDAAKDGKIKNYAERLASNVFLVNFRSCPAALASLVASAEHRTLIRFFSLLKSLKGFRPLIQPQSLRGSFRPKLAALSRTLAVKTTA